MVDTNPNYIRVSGEHNLALHVHTWGSPSGEPILLLHGFGQTGLAWEKTARQLAGLGYYCLAPDMRGHGDSEWASDSAYELEHFHCDALKILDTIEQTPIVIGASMGGLLAMAVEAESPTHRFKSMILVDITPRWEQDGVDRILGFMEAHPDGFRDFEHAREAISTYLPHRKRNGGSSRLQKVLKPGANGRLRWHWDPALLKMAKASSGQHGMSETHARALTLPVLLVSGGMSDIVSKQTINEFRALVPHARHVEISRAHHMVAGDDNDSFTKEILDFIAVRLKTA